MPTSESISLPWL